MEPLKKAWLTDCIQLYHNVFLKKIHLRNDKLYIRKEPGGRAPLGHYTAAMTMTM